ncbi:MAG: outer membrane protein assembly factor BamD [Gammaproteobacteria bacterium]
MPITSPANVFQESNTARNSRRTTSIVLALMSALVLGGCSLFGEKSDPTAKWSAQRLYDEAKSALQNGDYETAVDLYEKLESRYPFGPLAQQAQLDVAYAYYKYDEPASAIAAADRFIKLHPQSENVAYMLYLKGLTNSNKGIGFFERYFPKDPARRDVGPSLDAFRNFEELVQRFPNSKYTEDANQRMLFLRNVVSEHELHVAKYYLRRRAYVAAVNRAKYILENYQTSPVVPDALTVMAKSYKIMGFDDLSADALRVLELNFPGHEGIDSVRELELG